MLWMVMATSGSCDLLPITSDASSGGVVFIDKPVGRGPLARNDPEDVRSIQEALNQVTVKGAAGGTLPFLDVDGIIGPKTQAAIDRFQQVQLQIFDGLIEPKRKTLARLNEILDPVTDEQFRNKIRQVVPLVVQALSATLLNLQAVITQGPTPGPAAIAADRLNRHFRLDTLTPFKQSEARVNLFQTYTRFITAITRPDLFNIKLLDEFQLNKAVPFFASAVMNGFFMTDVVSRGRRVDQITVGLRFFGANVSLDFASYILLHELAHFVGDTNTNKIDDFGRGWFNDRFIAPLSAETRLRNADSYATFALECRFGSPAKPPFVTTSPGGKGGAR